MGKTDSGSRPSFLPVSPSHKHAGPGPPASRRARVSPDALRGAALVALCLAVTALAAPAVPGNAVASAGGLELTTVVPAPAGAATAVAQDAGPGWFGHRGSPLLDVLAAGATPVATAEGPRATRAHLRPPRPPAKIAAAKPSALVQRPPRLSRACGYNPRKQELPRLGHEQLRNARTIVEVAQVRRLPARAAVIALATAYQESWMRNIAWGDRDSLGLFQQRPSYGWGTPKQILTPTYAAGRFYSPLTRLPRWQQLPLTVAAQTVQRSGFPDRYAQWELMAATLVDRLLKVPDRELNCTHAVNRPTPTNTASPPAGWSPRP